MRVAMLTPLPPSKSGVAHYASLLLPALAKKVGIEPFESLDGYRRDAFDAVIYQLGNNPHHAAFYEEAMREPGVVVLHDLVLHHLIVEMTLATGAAEPYVDSLRANHGDAGAAWALGRAAGLHDEIGNFLLPASVEVARRSRAVIVHNEYARARLLSFGVETPVHVVPHPYVAEARTFDRDAIRRRLGVRPDQRVIGLFGFLTSAKRGEVVVEAFRRARAMDPRLTLLIVGEPAPNIDLDTLAGEAVITTGYVPDDEFPALYAAADRLVNLRYPSAGETSGTLVRAFDAGKPVAISDYAQFAEFPDDVAVKIPIGDGEVERLVEFLLADLPSPAAEQRRWLEDHARLEATIEGYLAALEDRRAIATARVAAAIPLFPRLSAAARIENGIARITLRNEGDATIRTRTYGEPEYRMVAKWLDDTGVIADRWLALPCDLHAGSETTVETRVPGNARTLRLHHALQGVPMLDPEAFAELSL